MKKKKYIQPLMENFRITPPQLLTISEGWSQNGGNVIHVEQEGDDWKNSEEIDDDIGGYGGWGDDGFIPID
jgi:hypothetical protein